MTDGAAEMATSIAIGTGTVVTVLAVAKTAGVIIATGALLALGFHLSKRAIGWAELKWAMRKSNLDKLEKEHVEGVVS